MSDSVKNISMQRSLVRTIWKETCETGGLKDKRSKPRAGQCSSVGKWKFKCNRQ